MFEPEENSRSWKSRLASLVLTSSLLAWHHAWGMWQLPYPDRFTNKLCFSFHIISHELTFWNTRLKSSNKRALLEKIVPLCDWSKSYVTSHGAKCQTKEARNNATCWHSGLSFAEARQNDVKWVSVFVIVFLFDKVYIAFRKANLRIKESVIALQKLSSVLLWLWPMTPQVQTKSSLWLRGR